MNSVSTRFNQLASAGIRPLDWELGISWTKKRNSDTAWFTLDQSTLGGEDLLASDTNNPIQLWDAYEYQMMRDRVIELSVQRSVEFPYNIQAATCDIKLDNHDGYLSYDNPDSPIAKDILPGRPCRIYLGFRTAGVTPVFVGTTQEIPSYSGQHNTTAQITAMDFLATIGEMSLSQMVMMRNVRTDEVIAVILRQFGLEDYMFSLEKGINRIPFVYFESGKDARNALRELVQAENGAMWIDEAGIIRFAPRTSVVGQQSVASFDKDNIISISASQKNNIVNKVYVEADVREVKEYQQIFSMENTTNQSADSGSDQYRINSNSSQVVWLNFDDPIWSATTNPVLNGSNDNSMFTIVNTSGDPVNSGVTAIGELFATSMKLTFSNTNNFPVSISYLQIWGEPAKVIGDSPSIKYTAQDDESIEAFGTQALEITDNTCFGNLQNIDAFATDVLQKYAGYSPILELEIKGNPALQIHDIITLNDTDYDGTYLIKAISQSLSDSKLTTKVSLVAHTVVSPFILNKSVLNGPDVLG